MWERLKKAYSFKFFGKRICVKALYQEQLDAALIDLAKWQHHADFAIGNVYLLEDRVARLNEVVKNENS